MPCVLMLCILTCLAHSLLSWTSYVPIGLGYPVILVLLSSESEPAQNLNGVLSEELFWGI